MTRTWQGMSIKLLDPISLLLTKLHALRNFDQDEWNGIAIHDRIEMLGSLLKSAQIGKAADSLHSSAALQKLAHHASSWSARTPAVAFLNGAKRPVIRFLLPF